VKIIKVQACKTCAKDVGGKQGGGKESAVVAEGLHSDRVAKK
jgi:hypothetical protein